MAHSSFPSSLSLRVKDLKFSLSHVPMSISRSVSKSLISTAVGSLPNSSLSPSLMSSLEILISNSHTFGFAIALCPAKTQRFATIALSCGNCWGSVKTFCVIVLSGRTSFSFFRVGVRLSTSPAMFSRICVSGRCSRGS